MQAPGSICSCDYKLEPGYEGWEPDFLQDPESIVCSRLAPNPVDDAGLLSFATFSWLTPVMIRSYKHTLTVDTLPPLSPYDSSDINAKRYQAHQGSGTVSKGSLGSLHLRLLPLWKPTPTGAADPSFSVAVH
jgi:hypothetical protein